jgi:hypothetical protein
MTRPPALAAACGVLMLLAAPVSAQETPPPVDRPTILVVGSGSAEAAPDTFLIKAAIEQVGPDRDAALRAMTETQARLVQGLGRMEGLTRVRLTTDALSVTPVSDPACDLPFGRERECPVIGYKAAMPIIMTGSPASQAGDAVSLASELGARSATLDSFSLSDTAALTRQANRDAFLDARRQAETLAEASGQRIVRVLRVSDANSRPYVVVGTFVTEAEPVVTGERVRAAVPITVAPAPTRVRANISVLFEIE